MKHFSNDGCNKTPEYDDGGYILRDEKYHDLMKDYEFSIAGHSDDEYDSIKEYEGPSHFND